jgi:DNA polymerase III alpha subunit
LVARARLAQPFQAAYRYRPADHGQRRRTVEAARRYRELFGPERFWIELQRHYQPGDDYLVRQLVGVAGYTGLLSDERPAMPDIDLDFESERREEVIQHIYDTYGPTHVAMACTFVTFQTRSALRDVGKVLDLPANFVTAAAHSLDTGEPPVTVAPVEQGRLTGPARLPSPAPMQHLLNLCRRLEEYPRHLGIHNGGMVITARPLMSRVPTEPAAMAGRVVVQWDKEALEVAGLSRWTCWGCGCSRPWPKQCS